MTDASDSVVMFDTAFLSLQKALGARLDGPLRAGFRELGVDLEKLQAAYPMETWEASLQLVARTVYPELPKEEAWRRIGQDFLTGFVQTPLGQAALLMSRVLGLRRTLHRMERNFRTTTNSLNISVTDVAERQVELVIAMQERFLPRWVGRELSLSHYRRGMLEGVLTTFGATGSVELFEIDRQRQRTSYRITWE